MRLFASPGIPDVSSWKGVPDRSAAFIPWIDNGAKRSVLPCGKSRRAERHIMQEGGSLFPFGSQSADCGEIWAGKALDRFFCVRSVAMKHRKPSPVPWDGRQTRRLCAKKKNAGLGITELEYSELTYCFENGKIQKILLTLLHGGDILFNVAARDKRSCEDAGFPWSPEKEDILNQISDNQIEMQP